MVEDHNEKMELEVKKIQKQFMKVIDRQQKRMQKEGISESDKIMAILAATQEFFESVIGGYAMYMREYGNIDIDDVCGMMSEHMDSMKSHILFKTQLMLNKDQSKTEGKNTDD